MILHLMKENQKLKENGYNKGFLLAKTTNDERLDSVESLQLNAGQFTIDAEI